MLRFLGWDRPKENSYPVRVSSLWSFVFFCPPFALQLGSQSRRLRGSHSCALHCGGYLNSLQASGGGAGLASAG